MYSHNNRNHVIGMLREMYCDFYSEVFESEEIMVRKSGYSGIIKDRPPIDIEEAKRETKEFFIANKKFGACLVNMPLWSI